jgi:hypothetical protein
VVTTIGPPLTIVTALMIYFGWARSNAQARSMGLDVNLFGYSAQDYVFRSISTLYVPLLVIAVIALGWLVAHRRIDRLLDRPRLRPVLRIVGLAVLGTGLLLTGLAVLAAIVDRSWAPLVVPLIMAAGAAIAAYGDWLARAARDLATPLPVSPPWQRALLMLLVGSVITLGLFWQVSNYAAVVGRGYALEVARNGPQLPRAIAFSPSPHGSDAPGVREERIDVGADPDDAVVRYRTTGLRLLDVSGGRIFLLHDQWTPREGTVIVLPDDPELRWQFSR